MSNLVSIIIVNWNGAEVLPECLESLMQLNHQDFEIVVVDNGSADDSVSIINKTCGDRARVICLDKNVGFAAGMNIGFENARGEFFAALNNDMVAEPSWLDQPLELMRNDNTVGMVSCRQMNYYDRDMVDGLYHCVSKGLILSPLGRERKYRRDDDLFAKPGYVMSANGGSAVIRAKTVRAVGGFDSDFFGYMEETDFFMRAFLRGWRCAYAPDAVVYHKDGFTFKKNRERQFYLHERNRIWYLYKNVPLSVMARSLHYLLAIELQKFLDSCLEFKTPMNYLKSRWDGLCGLRRYREIRKENAALFNGRAEEFYRLKKFKKLVMANS